MEHIYHMQAFSTGNSDAQLRLDVAKLKDDLVNSLITLYCRILEYQALSVRQFARSKLTQLGRDMVAWDSWGDLLREIKESESEVEKAQIVLDSYILQEGFAAQAKETKDLYETIEREFQRRKDEEEERQCLEVFHRSDHDFDAVKNRNVERVDGTCEVSLVNSLKFSIYS